MLQVLHGCYEYCETSVFGMHISYLAYGAVWNFVQVFILTYELDIREPLLGSSQNQHLRANFNPQQKLSHCLNLAIFELFSAKPELYDQAAWLFIIYGGLQNLVPHQDFAAWTYSGAKIGFFFSSQKLPQSERSTLTATDTISHSLWMTTLESAPHFAAANVQVCDRNHLNQVNLFHQGLRYCTSDL